MFCFGNWAQVKTLSALEPGKLRAAHLPPRGLEGDCADASVDSGWIRYRGSRGGTGRGVGGVRGAAPLSMSPAAHLHEPSVAQRVSSKPPRSLCARATVECHDVDAVRRTHRASRRSSGWNGTHTSTTAAMAGKVSAFSSRATLRSPLLSHARRPVGQRATRAGLRCVAALLAKHEQVRRDAAIVYSVRALPVRQSRRLRSAFDCETRGLLRLLRRHVGPHEGGACR